MKPTSPAGSAPISQAGAPAGLPNLLVLATGGTIAGAAAAPEILSRYQAGSLGIGAMLEAVPQLRAHARLQAEQLAQINSKDMDFGLWEALARRVAEAMDDPALDGVLITHGTDTMEETAFFLGLAVDCRKPVVLCGAMRPATALSADGPLNLLHAVRVAADPGAAGRGPLIVMHQQAFAAAEALKFQLLAPDAFAAPLAGPVARVEDGGVRFLRPAGPAGAPGPVAALRARLAGLPPGAPWPWVELVASHAGASGGAAEALLAAGVQGLVAVGTGAGTLHKALLAPLAAATGRGLPVVRASRVPLAAVERDAAEANGKLGFAAAGRLSPQKARIVLLLALRAGLKQADLQALLDVF
ncbi:MAG: asparaginase [Candidatus Protistobacter heckmanni]|nr:asparaginase [Candidatus Protistobacter heckmanni]